MNIKSYPEYSSEDLHSKPAYVIGSDTSKNNIFLMNSKELIEHVRKSNKKFEKDSKIKEKEFFDETFKYGK